MFAINDIVFWTKGDRDYYDLYRQPLGIVQSTRNYTFGGSTTCVTATCKSIIDGRKAAMYLDSRRADSFEIVARKGLDKW